MNVQSIGEHANHIWKLLSGEHRKWTYDEIKEKIGLPDRKSMRPSAGWRVKENCPSRKLIPRKETYYI